MWVKNMTTARLKTIVVALNKLKPARYSVKFYDTFTGEKLSGYEEIADKDVLSIVFPEFEKDIAVKVERFKK